MERWMIKMEMRRLLQAFEVGDGCNIMELVGLDV
jgi:hypothetical protein